MAVAKHNVEFKSNLWIGKETHVYYVAWFLLKPCELFSALKRVLYRLNASLLMAIDRSFNKRDLFFCIIIVMLPISNSY